jgi:hypothetical protein
MERRESEALLRATEHMIDATRGSAFQRKRYPCDAQTLAR